MKLNLVSLIAYGLNIAAVSMLPGVAGAESAPKKLAITEATYHPGNFPQWEWIELYNGSSETIDLSTYVLDNVGGDRFKAPNLSGKVGPGKFAIIYDFMDLKSTCKTEDGCTAFFQQAWPKVADEVVMVPFNVPGHQAFPTLWRSDQVLTIWASFADYSKDTDPVDLRKKPKHAVASVASTTKTFDAYDKRADRTTEPTVHFSVNGPTAGDEGSWSFSAAGKDGAYRSTKNESMTDNNGGKDVGSPGQLP